MDFSQIMLYNIYVLTFYHVDTAAFMEHLSVFAYDLVYFLQLSFSTTVLQHLL